MQVIPRTHKGGMIKHREAESNTSVLALELEDGTYSPSDAVSLQMKAGCISLHDDALIHGSPANPSDRWRTGLTMRFSGTNVKCDLSINPRFEAFMVHGVDAFSHNPQGAIPIEMFARYEAPGRHVRAK
jgi:ectoine hydroxylase-related dioxygenase (phytanoyl-CoA dioxygenase family)